MPVLPRRGTQVLATACLLWVAATAVRAEAAWERPIRDGIVAQDREIARSGAKSVLRRLESQASREADVPTLYLLARAYGKAGDAASALTTYGDVLKQAPDCWFAWRDRGVLRAMGKDLKGAEEDLRRAVQVKPDYADALQPLGVLLVETKRYDEGVRILQRVLDADPARESARMQIVEAWLEAGRPDDALREISPLLTRSPRDPGLRHVQGRVLAAKGDTAGALAVYKQLAIEFPDRDGPLRTWLGVAAKSGRLDPDETIWVLERLRRIVPKPEEKQAITEQIESIRRQMSAGQSTPAGPPTPAALAAQVRDPDVARRRLALLYLLQAAKETLTLKGDLLLALVERLDPVREPAAGNRALALAVFERYASAEIAPVVRGSLRDPDGDVRCKAADVLRKADTPFATAALARHATGQDAALATSARLAIYGIARVAPPYAEDTPEAQAVAFRIWWAGPDGRAAKTKAIAAVATAADLAPDELIFQFVIDEDPEVRAAAYRGLKALVPGAVGGSPRAAWMRTLPEVDEAGLRPDRRDAFLETMITWWEKRPS